jgi:hypothetical protein
MPLDAARVHASANRHCSTVNRTGTPQSREDVMRRVEGVTHLVLVSPTH